jgi:hypothetical protein
MAGIRKSDLRRREPIGAPREGERERVAPLEVGELSQYSPVSPRVQPSKTDVPGLDPVELGLKFNRPSRADWLFAEAPIAPAYLLRCGFSTKSMFVFGA